jgi:PIN domain nuclease of toxin-antitoxin system
VWVQNGPKSNFSEAAATAIRHAAEDDALIISAISVWELGLLLARGRVQFPGYSARDWIREALATPGLSTIDVDANIAFDSTQLPGPIHADPADRIIVATARHLGATLLTRDRKLIEYGRQGHLKVIAT